MQTAQWMRAAGQWCFALMWIPFIFIFVGMIGMPDGDYGWSELPIITRYSLVATGVLFVGTFVFQIGALFVGSSSNDTVLENGLPAKAKVLEINDTGITINENPIVRLRLEVQPHDMPYFEAEAEKLISRLHIPQYQPGEMINVKYDPDTSGVAVVDAQTDAL